MFTSTMLTTWFAEVALSAVFLHWDNSTSTTNVDFVSDRSITKNTTNHVY